MVDKRERLPESEQVPLTRIEKAALLNGLWPLNKDGRPKGIRSVTIVSAVCLNSSLYDGTIYLERVREE